MVQQNLENLTIKAIGAGGDGISESNGKSVFVPKTAPGDIIAARIQNQNAEGIQARLTSIAEPSPDRVNPPCPYFKRCGGCALQHVNEDFYRNWKTGKVLQTLQRANVAVEHVEETVFLPATTRRRTTMAAVQNGKDIIFGYSEVRSHNIVDAKMCLILEPELNDKIQSLRPYLPRLLSGQRRMDIMLQHTGGAYDMVLTGLKMPLNLEQLEMLGELAENLNIARISAREKEFAAPEILFTRHKLIKNFGDLPVVLPPGAFLQASAAGETALVEAVLRYAGSAARIADLFSGCGTFTGALLQKGVKVFAADGDAEAIKALSATKHANLTTARRNLFKEPLSMAELNKFEAVVFDPPRAGAKEQCKELAQSDVPRVIAVSCSPSSFARDARALIEGGYDLESLTIVDQFVWSSHVELVALFRKD